MLDLGTVRWRPRENPGVRVYDSFQLLSTATFVLLWLVPCNSTFLHCSNLLLKGLSINQKTWLIFIYSLYRLCFTFHVCVPHFVSLWKATNGFQDCVFILSESTNERTQILKWVKNYFFCFAIQCQLTYGNPVGFSRLEMFRGGFPCLASLSQPC